MKMCQKQVMWYNCPDKYFALYSKAAWWKKSVTAKFPLSNQPQLQKYDFIRYKAANCDCLLSVQNVDEKYILSLLHKLAGWVFIYIGRF